MPPATDPASLAPTAPRWLRPALLASGLVLFLVSVVVTTVQNLDSPWTSVRLAPTFALVRGYPLYSLPDQGPWVMVGYGPLYPWMYLPCALARGPVLAVALGTLLAHLYLLVPVALLCREFGARLAVAGADRTDASWRRVLPWSGLLFFGVIACLVDSVESVSRHIHVDAPTFSLLLLACYAALRAGPPAPGRPGMGWIVAAGVCAGMSLCCKVNVLGSIGALGLFVWWSAGWRRLLTYAAAGAGVVALVYGWAAWQSGGAAILHNFRTLGHFPWHKFQALKFNNWSYGECSSEPKEKLFAAGYLALQTIQTYGVPFLATALFAYILGRRPPGTAVDLFLAKALFAYVLGRRLPGTAVHPVPGPGRMIGCLLFVTMCGAPASITSVAKYGGEVNSWAFVGLPLSMAAVLTVLALLDRASRVEWLAAHAVLSGMVLTVLLGSALVFQKLNPRGGTGMGEAFHAIKTHPGQCYFATDPLNHLLTGEPFRPNLDTVYSYWVGGAPVDADAFRRTMPAGLRYVVISRKMEGWGGDEVRRLLPEENVETDELGLKFHNVLTKP